MTTLQQAAQQALECIERCNAHGWILADFEGEVYAAITALREALAQPAQRPWQGLTDDDWDKVGDMPDTFDQGATWAQARLKERNNE